MRKLRTLCAAVCVAALGLGVAPCAYAAPQKPASYQQRMEAKRLFDQAHLAYERGRYEEAILKWEKSYALSGEPLIFESIANAFERLGDPKQARENLAKWRAEAPENEWSALDERLASLDARIDEQLEAEAEAEQRRREQEQQQQQVEEERERNQRERERQRDERAEDRDRGAVADDLTIAGWTLAAVGAAAVVAGVVVDAIAISSRPDEATACASVDGQQLCRQDARDDIEGANTMAIAGDVTWIAGTAVGVTGVVLLVAAFVEAAPQEPGADSARGDASARSTPRLRIVPAAGEDGAGLWVVGRF